MPGKGLPASAFGAGGSPQTVMLKYGAGVNSTVGGAAVAVPGAVRGWEACSSVTGGSRSPGPSPRP